MAEGWSAGRQRGPGADAADADPRVRKGTLVLLKACLTYDFLSSNMSEETADDAGSAQIPSIWRPIFEDRTTLQLAFDTYTRLAETPLGALVRDEAAHQCHCGSS